MVAGFDVRGHQRSVDANGLTLAITEYPSEGPPLVLLHGIGNRAVSWWPVVGPLAAHFSLYAVDLRGHGASSKPATGYLLADYEADLAALLDALALARPRILGHSLGGLVALHWACSAPNRATAIALEDTELRTSSRSLPAFDDWLTLNAMTVDEAAATCRIRYPDWSDEDCRRRAESITLTSAAVFTELRDATALTPDADRIAPLAVIESPVLLVHGDPDASGVVVPSDADRFVATLPRARALRIPGAGHAIHRDHPDEFLAAVVPFLLGNG